MLDIGTMFRDAELTDRTQTLNKKDWEDHWKPELRRQGHADIDAGTDTSEDEKRQMKKELDAKLDDLTWEPKDKEKNPKEDLFWVPVRRLDTESEEPEPKMIDAGRIQCSFRIYAKAEAEKGKQGVGREEPNNDPLCPPPEGRIKLSLNPFEMFNQLIGPAVRRKIYCCLCCMACLALCVMMAPMIFSNLVAAVMTG